MNTIAIFHLASLTDEQKATFLSLSKTGNPAWLDTLPIRGGGRIRNVELDELILAANNSPIWVAPEYLEDETTDEYLLRVKVETLTAFSQLWEGLYIAMWMPESGYQLLTKQPEVVAVAEQV